MHDVIGGRLVSRVLCNNSETVLALSFDLFIIIIINSSINSRLLRSSSLPCADNQGLGPGTGAPTDGCATPSLA